MFNSTSGDGRYVARKELHANGAIDITYVLALRPVFNMHCVQLCPQRNLSWQSNLRDSSSDRDRRQGRPSVA